MNKFYLLIVSIFFPLLMQAQFDNEEPKIKLFDNAKDIEIYNQMAAKDKLYLIYNLKKEQAGKEMDYALAMISENINNIDMNENDPKIRSILKKVKDNWLKLNAKLTQNLTPKDFTSLFFEVNTFDRLIYDLVTKMRETYDLPNDKLEKYDDVQNLRELIQKINLSYYANYLGLSKSFMHEYQKNIKSVNDFIKKKSNLFLNDPVAGTVFPDVIVDWNFLRANLLHTSSKNPKTVFSLVTAIDFKLKDIKNTYIENLTRDF